MQYKYSAMGAVYLGSILVTGGSGFIGRNLCKSALHWGFDVAVITRDKKMARKILPTPVTLYSCLDEIAEGTQYDSLVNLAGESLASGRWTETRKQKFYDSRIGFTDRKRIKETGSIVRRYQIRIRICDERVRT